MEANPRSPRDLFEGRTHYEIPAFQRPYVWNEEDQWAPLWDDVTRVAESHVNAQLAGTQASIPQHFLGALVYESKSAITGDVTRHLVIDGQQRMTTLQLLLDAVQSVIDAREYEILSEALEDLILNTSKAFKGKPERFKLWPSQSDRDAFVHAMDPGSGKVVKEHRILDAHTFLAGEARRWIAGEADDEGRRPPGSEADRVNALCTTLADRLVLVAIDLSGHDDAQLIFETLNDRGTPLLKADLIKNWVFREGEKVGADVDLWSRTYWADFDSPWWREEISQGRHSRSRVDIFLQYWLTMMLRDEVKGDNIFRDFAVFGAPHMTSARDASAMLGQMQEDAHTYRNFAELDETSAEGRFHKRVIETMELAATTPVLLWMLSKVNAVPREQIRIGLEALESWVIRRTLLRYTAKDVNRFMVAILKELDGVPADQAGDRLRAYLSAQTADARMWPTDAEIIAQLPSVRVYGNIRQSRVQVVLGAVEQHLRDASPMYEAVSMPTGLSIEHVMPRGWRTHWDTRPKLSPEAAAERDRLLNTLGNLTLVTRSLNSALSNRPWTNAAAKGLKDGGAVGKGKRSLLDQFSLLILNKRIVASHEDEWTEDDIAQRSVRLAEAICAVWPGPVVVRDEPEVIDGELEAVEISQEQDLARTFHAAMLNLYKQALTETGYNASLFASMISVRGGLQTARDLLASSGVSQGFTALWEKGRLDLVVEALVLDPQYQELFSDEELEIARERLAMYGAAG